ncbi:heme-binding protein [Tianweitania populi]|uniref:ATP--cob(I)alamin adenosyltransferase n=1 Tax=Tianweitania populi TaxID=1607949 RepID=A0A8J3DN74_9HYPH|nr:heme-binding protein [Tianweitania populi]GHD12342.1 ATP--cob(I)alamin adenosyltransferase [Tianweitania populi]
MTVAPDMDRIATVLRAELTKLRQLPSTAPGSLTLADAQLLAEGAEACARIMGLPVCIAVADAQGGLILFHRMQGSLPASTQLAQGKAWTAAAYRMGSDELGQKAQPGGMLFGVGQTGGPNGGQVVLFGGGIPCRVDGVVIGAIGISGGTVDEDMIIARHALNTFSEARGTLPEEGTGL